MKRKTPTSSNKAPTSSNNKPASSNKKPASSNKKPIELMNWSIIDPYNSGKIAVQGTIVSKTKDRDFYVVSHTIKSAKLINPDCLSCTDVYGDVYILPVKNCGDFVTWKKDVLPWYTRGLVNRFHIPMDFVQRAWKYRDKCIAKYERSAKKILAPSEVYLAVRGGVPAYMAYRLPEGTIVSLPLDLYYGFRYGGSAMMLPVNTLECFRMFSCEPHVPDIVAKMYDAFSHSVVQGLEFYLELVVKKDLSKHILDITTRGIISNLVGFHIQNDCSKNVGICLGRGRKELDICCEMGKCTYIPYDDKFSL